jgi:ferredoxin--NADP+ reductase
MTTDRLRVAVVGSGPSGFFVTDQLLREDATVDMFDLLPTPYGLVRYGVAPDHPNIKSVSRVFDRTASHPGFRFYGNVEIGHHVQADELAAWYDAVVYAYGSDRGKLAGIPGDHLDGNHSAATFVNWYNGHPHYRDEQFDLSGQRAVVIGNGNVALDIARLLSASTTELASTDIADHALDVLQDSRIREVIVLGRRGPEHASFTHPELLEIGSLPGVDVVVDPRDIPVLGDVELPTAAQARLATLRAYASRTQSLGSKRIVLRFNAVPVRVHGDHWAESLEIAHHDAVEALPARLLIHAVGYIGSPIAGLPFDDVCGVIPNDAGRIHDVDHYPVVGQYVTGWIKRGANGVIGTNKACARETVDTLLDDVRCGRLARTTTFRSDMLDAILIDRGADRVDYSGWKAIDEHEQRRGRLQDRPRLKVTRIPEMVTIARSRPSRSGLNLERHWPRSTEKYAR